MLDNETKRRIDTARDILVGKVPDPKSQVEQITIALVYKFMDDMDKDSVDMGGKASFFTGEYERYAWSRIFDPHIGGFEMLNLYSEAIVKLNHNPGIPQLFRDIFKNAYLPYRDPETLKLFLKTINEFHYDHSEKLGDAFEYLLSVLGSQGDAGQFRTPRHIIDFMVQLVKPQKHEIILDPACGTAGFLISAYKYIVNENTKKIRGDQLLPDERKRLLTNFKGFDISPDMVRLSLVNMYLHGFVQPLIYEYDTLTSEDRWNEYADVILANPPFMSPKGGIKPHKRFSVQCNRSEVLFVDYIAEHLTPSGRAAVIVPEGIIFQSAGAYKQLRKMLVEKFLYAVVSLPAGVFNPYSGVKTSILLMDRQLARKADSVLFLKIDNDGFGLGAQRREIEKNDLPGAVVVIEEYVKAIRSENSESFNLTNQSIGPLLVSKKELTELGEYNLTGDRYRNKDKKDLQKFRLIRLGELCEIFTDGDWVESKDQAEIGIRLIQTGNVGFGKFKDKTDKSRFIAEEKFSELNCTEVFGGDVLISRLPDPVGRACVVPLMATRMIASVDCTIVRFIKSKYLPELFVALSMTNDYYKEIFSYLTGASRQRISRSNLANIRIPAPPLEVQQEIVAEIEGYQKIIDGARQVVDNWKPQIEIDPAWPMVRLGDVCAINPESADPKELFGDNSFTYIDITSVGNGTGRIVFNKEIKPGEAPSRARRIVSKQDVLLSTVRPNLKAFAYLENLPERVLASTGFAVLRHQEIVDSRYLYFSILADQAVNQMINLMGKGAYPSINSNDVENLIIPLPPLSVQQELVAKIETERNAIDSCRELIAVYEGKIKQVIDKVWGDKKI